TGRRFSLGFGGLVLGLTYALIHIVTIQVDNTSLNPARSFGTAIYATSDSDAFEQLWVFIIFPLIGAVVGIFLWLMLDESRLEGTMLDSEALRKVRDVADDAVDS